MLVSSTGKVTKLHVKILNVDASIFKDYFSDIFCFVCLKRFCATRSTILSPTLT